MVLCQEMFDYLKEIEREHGSVLNAPIEKQKHLQSLAPKKGPNKRVINQIKRERGNRRGQIMIPREKVDRQRIKWMIVRNDFSIKQVDQLLGVNISKFLPKNSGGKKANLYDLEAVCDLIDLLPADVLAEGAILDKNIYLDQNWVDLKNFKKTFRGIPDAKFKEMYKFSKEARINGGTRFTLFQLKKIGEPKNLMTKEGYEELEEILSDYRPIEHKPNKRFKSAWI